jgi:hypothetical protein
MNIWFVKPERWSGQMAAHAGARRAPSRSQLVAACFVLLAMAAASSAFVLEPPLPALAGQGAAQNRPHTRLRTRGGHRSVHAMAGFGTGFGSASPKKAQGKKKAAKPPNKGALEQPAEATRRQAAAIDVKKVLEGMHEARHSQKSSISSLYSHILGY